MGALERFLAQQDKKFDVDSIISAKVREFDEVRPPSSVFKYLSSNRREFFRSPTLRFTQRTSLNDPFELMSRWREFASASTRAAFAKHIQESFGSLAADKGMMLELLKQQKAKEGIFLGPNEMAEAANLLLSEKGQQRLEAAVNSARQQLGQGLDNIFAALTFGAQQSFDEITAKLGILSLSETAESRAMWSLYASAGQGFVVEFDSTNSFFTAPNNHPLIWKVEYQDKPEDDFMQYPLSLLLTKHEEYSFEKEWRMIKYLSECEEVPNSSDEKVYVCPVRPGMIKSIIFGYNYLAEDMIEDGARVRALFNPQVHIKQAIANRKSGNIEIRELI